MVSEEPKDEDPGGSGGANSVTPGEETPVETVRVRTSPTTCDNAPVDEQAVIDDPNIGGECSSKADCTAQEHGYCGIVGGQIYQTVCKYGCEVDDDCGAEALCECGADVGTCVPATCRTSDDCGGGRCLRIVEQDACSDGFGPRTFYKCESSADTCITDKDCTDPQVCLSNPDGTRSCRERQLCGIGRPFLVESEIRQAEVKRRSDWSSDLGSRLAHLNAKLSDAQRAELAEAWTNIALMEHASVAAFARFQLQLLALGSPAELIEATNQALVDETRHARLAFGLSEVFSGVSCGPGPLSIDGALSTVDLEEIALLVLLEGCIGETCAAMEAEWAAERCRDAVLGELVSEIGADEKRHAELAWRFIGWAVEQRPELSDSLLSRARFEAEQHRTSARPLARIDSWRATYGLVPEARRHALRSMALNEVVIPCLAELSRRAA